MLVKQSGTNLHALCLLTLLTPLQNAFWSGTSVKSFAQLCASYNTDTSISKSRSSKCLHCRRDCACPVCVKTSAAHGQYLTGRGSYKFNVLSDMAAQH